MMITPPILYLPKPGGRFILYCDSVRTYKDSSLWQIQEGKPRLIGYASKSMPSPAKNYSVTELEMTGMAETYTCGDTCCTWWNLIVLWTTEQSPTL